MPTLREARKNLKLTLEKVANDTGIDPSALSKIETGKQKPNKENARTLYEYFHGSVPLGMIYDPEYNRE